VSLLDHSVSDLLGLFAAGRTTPGAGSAAALTGAVAGSLIQAAARYAIRVADKAGAEKPFGERAAAILEEAGERSRRLSMAVGEDSEAFRQFWQTRTEEALRLATDIPIDIAEHCLALAEMGLELYDHGYQNARGEAAAASLGAIAGGEAALYAASLNLASAGRAGWIDSRKEKIDAFGRGLRDVRGRIEARIAPGLHWTA
jgi:formiminotetrahydrofolate cyclodeaminase